MLDHRTPAPSFDTPHGNQPASVTWFDAHGTSSGHTHAAEAAMRHQIEADIESVRAEIEEQITMLKRSQHETELTDQIDFLEGQLAFLDAQLAFASTASLSALMNVQQSVSRTVAAVQQSTHVAVAQAVLESGVHITELTQEKMAALDHYYEAQSIQFRGYEQQSFARMEQYAAANGVDITGYRETRAEFQSAFAEAQRSGDKVGMAEAEAGLAANNYFGLVAAGAPEDEQARALSELERARERFDFRVREAAMQAGQERGLEGDELRDYVDQQAAERLERFDNTAIETAVANGTPREEAERVMAEIADQAAENRTDVTELMARDATSESLTVELDHDDAVAMENDTALAAGVSDAAPSPFAGGSPFGAASSNPFGAASFEVADVAEDDTPVPASTPTPSGQSAAGPTVS
jgi:hypothetical protein